MLSGYFINAVCTLLNEDETLNVDGLEAHLADQWEQGTDGVLVGGSMGAMQLLRDATYRDLVERSVAVSKGRGEVLVGAGDTSFGRTMDRITFLNDKPIDGVVVLTPYMRPIPSQERLVAYYECLADACKSPFYLYDVPGLTGVSLDIDTYMTLSKHPNIKGAKISGRFMVSRHLVDQLGDDFRVIIAEPDMADLALRGGFEQQLDGIFSIAPHWLRLLREAAAADDWDSAGQYAQRFVNLRVLLMATASVLAAATPLLNARGISGNAFLRPVRALSEEAKQKLMDDPTVKELVGGERVTGNE
jgi:4-hydroxy-tetrahydrodipicolinate synthase